MKEVKAYPRKRGNHSAHRYTSTTKGEWSRLCDPLDVVPTDGLNRLEDDNHSKTRCKTCFPPTVPVQSAPVAVTGWAKIRGTTAGVVHHWQGDVALCGRTEPAVAYKRAKQPEHNTCEKCVALAAFATPAASEPAPENVPDAPAVPCSFQAGDGAAVPRDVCARCGVAVEDHHEVPRQELARVTLPEGASYGSIGRAGIVVHVWRAGAIQAFCETEVSSRSSITLQDSAAPRGLVQCDACHYALNGGMFPAEGSDSGGRPRHPQTGAPAEGFAAACGKTGFRSRGIARMHEVRCQRPACVATRVPPEPVVSASATNASGECAVVPPVPLAPVPAAEVVPAALVSPTLERPRPPLAAAAVPAAPQPAMPPFSAELPGPDLALVRRLLKATWRGELHHSLFEDDRDRAATLWARLEATA